MDEDRDNDDLDDLAEALGESVPAAPEIPPSSIPRAAHPRDAGERLEKLKSHEHTLLGVDRLLISDGARLVLFLPLLVIVLYGLAQSFTNSNPQWWVKHIEDASSPYQNQEY